MKLPVTFFTKPLQPDGLIGSDTVPLFCHVLLAENEVVYPISQLFCCFVPSVLNNTFLLQNPLLID